MARGMVPACRDNRPRSSTENHRKTPPDRLTEDYLLGPIYGLTPFLIENLPDEGGYLRLLRGSRLGDIEYLDVVFTASGGGRNGRDNSSRRDR
jgi:hypothetical protein